jgi:hypothetical protein
MAEFRTAIEDVAAAHPALCTAVAGPTLVTFPGNFNADQLHPNTTGHSEYWTNVDAIL